jgi:hypothetical protein
MKQLVFFSGTFFYSLFAIAQDDKLLQHGTITGDVGVGIVIYKTKGTDKTSNITENDTAGAFAFPLFVDYSINQWFSAGAGFRYNNFIEGDSASTEGVNAFDFALRPAFHFVNTRRLDFFISAMAGISYFSYKTNDLSDINLKGMGTVFGGGLTTRFFFSGNIGMYLNYTYSAINYSNLKGTASNGVKANYSLSGKGGVFGLGIAFKIK